MIREWIKGYFCKRGERKKLRAIRESLEKDYEWKDSEFAEHIRLYCVHDPYRYVAREYDALTLKGRINA